MKHVIPTIAFLLVCLPTTASAQTQIIPRGQYAVIDSAASASPTASQPSPQTTNGEQTRSGFPTLTPQAQQDHLENDTAGKVAGPAVTVTSSLAVVLGLFAGLVWLTRKYGARTMGHGAIPKEVLQSLGSMSIDARTRIAMLRCGQRILVVSQGPSGMQTLTEITDPEEVRELVANCLGESQQVFASTLESIEREPIAPGFVAPQPNQRTAQPQTRPETARERGRLFATA